MSQSSPTDPADERDWENFDLRRFVLDTIRSVEYGSTEAGLLDDRVARIEECVAAPWYRRWLLWRRLRREIRASVATWPDEYIPRGNFLGRRGEWAALTVSATYDRQAWKPRFGSSETGQGAVEDGAERAAEGEQQGAADPGAGFLP